MLRLDVLPAAHGDALVVTYGDRSDPRRVLVDGGPVHTYRHGLRSYLEALPRAQRRFELLVVTHIDADHIDGILVMLQDEPLGVTFDEVWFNAWPQLNQHEPDRGAKQGEFLAELLSKESVNAAFGGGPVRRGADQHVELPGGAKLVVLSPHHEQLSRLRSSWERAVRAAGLEPGEGKVAEDELVRRRYRPPATEDDDVDRGLRQFGRDSAVANGSSIALLFEYDGKRLLLAGDAHAPVLADGLQAVAAQREVDRVAVDLFKLPHHGSMANLSSELLSLVTCDHFIVSTNGAIFHHPDPEAVELIGELVPGRPTVSFNHRSATTMRWESEEAQQAAGIRSRYPEGESGLTIDL